jgi:hypothetical protein
MVWELDIWSAQRFRKAGREEAMDKVIGCMQQQCAVQVRQTISDSMQSSCGVLSMLQLKKQ